MSRAATRASASAQDARSNWPPALSEADSVPPAEERRRQITTAASGLENKPELIDDDDAPVPAAYIAAACEPMDVTENVKGKPEFIDDDDGPPIPAALHGEWDSIIKTNPKKKAETIEDEEGPMPDDYAAMLHEENLDDEKKNTKKRWRNPKGRRASAGDTN